MYRLGEFLLNSNIEHWLSNRRGGGDGSHKLWPIGSDMLPDLSFLLTCYCAKLIVGLAKCFNFGSRTIDKTELDVPKPGA